MLFDEKGERFCDVFVESGRVMNDFIRSFTRLRREEDLGSFDEALEASVGELPTDIRNALVQNEFDSVALSANLRCCAACYVRLHRLSSSNKNSTQNSILSPSSSVKTDSVGRPPSSFANASKRTKRRIKKKLKMCTRQKMNELKADVEKMGASYEEICKEILEEEFEKEQQDKKKHGNANIVEGLALSYSREKPGSPKRVELLSCVAQQYTNKELKEIFKYTNSRGEEVFCTDYEITKARLHSKVCGPGASVPKVNRRPCQKLPPETIAFVLEFIHHPDSVEYSSYKTASCEGKQKSWVSELLGGGNQPVLWLKQNKSALYDRYKQECQQLKIKAISFSTFFKGISAGNFKIMAEKAGLCNICTELGAENFIQLGQLLTQLGETLRSNQKPDTTPALITRAKTLKGYLLSEFQANLRTHSNCATHCASLWLSDNPPCGSIMDHQETCHSCLQIFHIIRDLKEICNTVNDPNVVDQITQIEKNLNSYIGHIIRGKYQREQFLIDINKLVPGEAVMVADYMMKLLFQKLFEPQKDWFAKRGYRYTVQCSFSKEKTPEKYLQNSTTYTVNQMTNRIGVYVSSFRNFEPQKGKTKLDGHYATLKFSLKRYRREGNDVVSGEQIEKGTNGRLRGTHVYGVNIDRLKEPESAKTMNGITEYSDFEYIYGNDNKLKQITARNQTRLSETKTFECLKLRKLWGHLECESTGATSNFSLEKAITVKDLPQRQTTTAKKKEDTGSSRPTSIITNVPDRGGNTCIDCGKSFLRKGNLQKHQGSCGKATPKTNTNNNLVTDIVAEIKSTQPQPVSSTCELSKDEKAWLYAIPGKADKCNRPARTNKRFSEQQKQIMIECYMKGVDDRNKRYTAAMCQEEMVRKLGEQNKLKESQIKSFWSRYHHR
ncbi:hypothetical protein ACROYT_G038430 [Oculina patagonica]